MDTENPALEAFARHLRSLPGSGPARHPVDHRHHPVIKRTSTPALEAFAGHLRRLASNPDGLPTNVVRLDDHRSTAPSRWTA